MSNFQINDHDVLLVHRVTNDGCEAIDAVADHGEYESMAFLQCSPSVGVCCDGGDRF